MKVYTNRTFKAKVCKNFGGNNYRDFQYEILSVVCLFSGQGQDRAVRTFAVLVRRRLVRTSILIFMLRIEIYGGFTMFSLQVQNLN